MKNQLILMMMFLIMLTTPTIAQLSGEAASGNRPPVIPPSPEAKLMARYIETPVSTYTGIPQIQIPIDNITSGSIGLNIGLSYHAGGHKVEDEASWVGLGWTINSGGMVGRGVRGLPDELPGTGYIDYTQTADYELLTSPLTAENFGKLTEVSYNCGDVEPDYFYFSVNGNSGKIIYQWGSGTPTVDAEMPWQATPTIANGKIIAWKLVSGDGSKYLFQEVETTEITQTSGLTGSCMPALYNSAWYLSRIEDVNSNHSITLQYATDRETYNTFFRYSDYFTLLNLNNNPACPGSGGGSTSHRIVYNRPRLSKITTDKGLKEIELIPGEIRQDIDGSNLHRLSELKINDLVDGSSKKFIFDNNDYSTGRLTLNSLIEQGESGGQLPAFEFTYNSTELPSVLSNAQDHWGFCNGNENKNNTLLPRSWVINNQGFPVLIDGGDREPDSRFFDAALLTQIRFPSGAVTEFDYEMNDFSKSISYTTRTQYATVLGDFASQGVNGYTNDPVVVENAGSEAYKIALIQIDEPTTLNLFTYGFHNGPTFPDAIFPYVAVYNNETGQTKYKREFRTPLTGNPQDNEQTNSVYLTKGTYRIVAYAVWNEDNEQPDRAFFQADYYKLVPISGPIISEAGGARIKRITQSAYLGDPNPEVRRYEYRLENGSSSGTIYMIPKYLQESVSYVTSGDAEYECTNQTVVSQNVANVGATQGSHIGYSRVTQFNGEKGQYGKQVFSYTSPEDYPGSIKDYPPYPPHSDQSYKTGLLTLSEYYEREGDTFNKYLQEQNLYDFHEYKIPTIKVQNRGGVQGVFYPHKFEVGFYSANIGHAKNVRTITTEYLDGQTRSTEQSNSYDDLLQRTRATNSSGESGEILQTEYYYPDDFTSPDNVIDELINRHMITSPIEVVQKRKNIDELVSGSTKSQYQVVNNSLQLYSTSTYRPLDAPILESVFDYTFDNILASPTLNYHVGDILTYNEQDNVVSVKNREKGLQSSFLWGYNFSFPVVSIVDVDYSTLRQLFTQSELNELNTTHLSEQEAQQLYQKLQTHFPGKQFQVYTYDVLNGMQSSIDNNGLITQYHYDEFGRLEYVEDHDGDLVTAYEYYLSAQE